MAEIHNKFGVPDLLLSLATAPIHKISLTMGLLVACGSRANGFKSLSLNSCLLTYDCTNKKWLVYCAVLYASLSQTKTKDDALFDIGIFLY